MTPLEIALVCWLIACGVAGLLQVLAAHGVGERSAWGVAVGWQREIALWNFALCVGISYALLSRDEACKTLIARIVAILSVVLGVNHVLAWRSSPATTHKLGMVANAAGFALILWGLLFR